MHRHQQPGPNASAGFWPQRTQRSRRDESGATAPVRPTAYSLQPTAFARACGRRGFTLVEILVVITIIGVLAGLVSVVAVRVLDNAKQTRIKTEVDALDLAMKAYKEKYGSYPPSTLAVAAVQQHISRAFPRYNITNLNNDLLQAGASTAFRPDQALVFWLRGFGPDPTNPFLTADDYPIVAGKVAAGAVRQTRQQPYFDFDRTRLQPDPYSSTLATAPPRNVPTAGSPAVPCPSYFPQGVKTDFTAGAYVYFDSFTYGTPSTTVGTPAIPTPFNQAPALVFSNAGTATPYWADTNGNGSTSLVAADLFPVENWVNSTTFQIIAPGMDGKYGTPVAPGTNAVPKCYPTGGASYDQPPPVGNLADDDNVTNFCPKARLADAKPSP